MFFKIQKHINVFNVQSLSISFTSNQVVSIIQQRHWHLPRILMIARHTSDSLTAYFSPFYPPLLQSILFYAIFHRKLSTWGTKNSQAFSGGGVFRSLSSLLKNSSHI